MFVVKNPGTWQQYLRANPTLPIMEAKRRFLIEQQNYNRVTGTGRPKSGGDPTPTASILPSGCIEFVNNTTDGTFSRVTVTTSSPTNYTITWGDGTEVTDVIDGELAIEHEYADSDTEYTVRLCFDDVSLVTELDFLGQD
jgi:hypothetical protein